MLHLIPAVKVLEQTEERFQKRAITLKTESIDPRILRVLDHLPMGEAGLPLQITVTGAEGEDYRLTVTNEGIDVSASGPAGAFYALQTLRQIWAQEELFCLRIEDRPDFAYRGFYHDVTRGKIPTMETLKDLIDRMAYFKLNSLQLYVEHVFEFAECADLNPKTGFLTGAELEELDAYCKESFIDFIPSLSTFGHMYEILQQEQYHHLRVLSDYAYDPNFWYARMAHHTVDPLQEESFELVSSLIDQFAPHFTSDTFNICCDETFDLSQHKRQDLDKGQMYVDFVQKIIAHLKGKNKKVMMWADILLKHPETISLLPEDTVFLNWMYSAAPDENKILKFASLGRKQIVCPGTTTWSRLCENVQVSEKNISLMAEYGKKHGAIGLLNTNWGDWGNPCSLELSLYGLVLGAAKAWAPDVPADETFHAAADTLLYGTKGAFELVSRISAAENLQPHWNHFCRGYFNLRHKNERSLEVDKATLDRAVEECKTLLREVEASDVAPAFREEMSLALRGLWLRAELSGKTAGVPMEQTADGEGWLQDYAAVWRRKNKESEIGNIEAMFRFLLAAN